MESKGPRVFWAVPQFGSTFASAGEQRHWAGSAGLPVVDILLMAEVLHHLGCVRPYE